MNDPAVWLLISGGLCVLIAGMLIGLVMAAWHSRSQERREVQRLTAERDRYRQHSITLNTVGWKIAEALGDVPDGADQIVSDPLGRAERLIAKCKELDRAEGADHA